MIVPVFIADIIDLIELMCQSEQVVNLTAVLIKWLLASHLTELCSQCCLPLICYSNPVLVDVFVILKAMT